MIIREARDHDLAEVIGLLKQDVIREVDESQVPVEAYAAAYAEILAEPRQVLLVGELDGGLVATAQVTFVRHLSYVGGLMCQLESVRVRDDVRGRGLGRQLIEHVIDLARSRDAVRVELTSNQQRERARRFYEGLGFRASHVGMKLYLRSDS